MRFLRQFVSGVGCVWMCVASCVSCAFVTVNMTSFEDSSVPETGRALPSVVSLGGSDDETEDAPLSTSTLDCSMAMIDFDPENE